MSLEENKALVRRFYEAGNKKNFALLEELVAPTCAVSLAGIAEPMSGPQALKQHVLLSKIAFPDLQVAIDDLTCEGDKVVVRWTCQGTHKGEFMGVAPTGKHVKFTGIDIYRLTGGKFMAIWSQFDILSVLKQLGVLPAALAR